MKASLQWLKEYVPIDVKPEELGDLLTMAGLEVEGMETIGEGFDQVIVSRILEVRPHPNADRLSLCMVDTGKDTIQVVCGAPNVEVRRVFTSGASGGKASRWRSSLRKAVFVERCPKGCFLRKMNWV